MWVRILVTDTTMCCPACMTNSASSLLLVILTYFAQISNATGTFTQLRPSCLSIDRCKTGTIVTTIFQQFESIQQKVRHRTCSIITNNSAHNFLRSTAKSADSTCYCDASRTAHNILQHHRCISTLFTVILQHHRCISTLFTVIYSIIGAFAHSSPLSAALPVHLQTSSCAHAVLRRLPSKNNHRKRRICNLHCIEFVLQSPAYLPIHNALERAKRHPPKFR